MKNIRSFAILLALPAIASVVATSKYKLHDGSSRLAHINLFGGTVPAYGAVSLAGAAIILFVLLTIVALVLQAMLTNLELEGAKGKTPSLKHLWSLGRKYWLRMFGLVLVISMYIVGASLIGGLALVILPGFIGRTIGLSLIAAAVLFVLTHYYLAPYAMVDKDLPIFDAMDLSATLSKQHIVAVLSVIAVAILLGFTGMIPFLGPIISFILGALYSVAPALRYEELKKLSK